MKAIGGYFELEMPCGKEFYPGALKFQSARSAFLALLRAGKPRTVWMPRYICDSMLSPLRAAGIESAYYDIDAQMQMPVDIKLHADDWLLCVNYYGISSKNINRVLNDYNPKQVIIDNSQAFFSPPHDSLATIYSPRKFFGVPDGGLLFSQLPITPPQDEDNCSMKRMTYLLRRLSESPEAGYSDFQEAEAGLEDMEPRKMSRLTQRLLLAQDMSGIRQKRNDNFMVLHKALSGHNLFPIDLSSVNGPLSYPFICGMSRKCRPELTANRIFVPTYWPDVLSRVGAGSREVLLVNDCLPLPCDQRYTASEMGRVAEIVLRTAHIHG